VNYKVGPEDIVVIDREGRRVPQAGPRGLHGLLRQRRVLLAAGLAALEILAVLTWGASTFTLVLFALLAVAAYFFVGRQLPQGAIREGAWIVAFAQGLLALVVVAIPVTVFFMLLLVAVVILVLLMRLLGERSRG
jgi:hypothetical protein